MEEVRELLEKGRFADDSLAETSPRKGQTLPTKKKSLNKILNCILDDRDMKTEELQKVIAGKFDIELSGFQDETSSAATLFEAFQRRKKFALIQDDLWEPSSLERVGIPIPTVENGCKLIITTRRVSVCRGMETTDRDIKVKGEALASPDIKLIAKDVAKECMGLPLGIVTVGRALRNATDIFQNGRFH
ncbi:hypothetical protein AHAS_Ahas16G0148200 [Arachis hypogaea]